MRVVASDELFNKVKYRNKDSAWMLVVHFFSTCRASIFARAQSCAFSRGKMLEGGALFPIAALGNLEA
jgi:hypothetical protein